VFVAVVLLALFMCKSKGEKDRTTSLTVSVKELEIADLEIILKSVAKKPSDVGPLSQRLNLQHYQIISRT